MSALLRRYSPWVDHSPYAEAKMHLDRDGCWVYHTDHVATLEALHKALAPLAEVARIADLYLGPPCANPSPLPDSDVVLVYTHGQRQVTITLGDCRKVQALLSS